MDHDITIKAFFRELGSLAKDLILGRCWNKKDLSYASDLFMT